MELKKLVRYFAVFAIKGLLGALLGVSLTIYQPALAEAPNRLQEDSHPLDIQTLLDSQYANKNYEISEAQEIKYKLYLETQRQGLLYWEYRRLAKVVQCESSFRHDGLYGDHGRAYGLAQFWEGTFYFFAKKANAEGLEYHSMDDQIQMLVWAYKNKQMNHWSCNKKV
jgi:hypothetical protein